LSEKIIGLTVSTLTGEKMLFSGLSNVHCRLIFTTERLIVQRLSSQTSQSYPDYRMDSDLTKFLVERGPESILGDSAMNFFIPYSGIMRVEVGKRWLNPRMNVVTHDKTYRFSWFWPRHGIKAVQHIARSLFPIEISVESVKKV
jgi:hypothetical protein